jgi:tetratricopeptide (TPR) repeat protein
VILELLLASLAVLPADRLAMADRLFNRGMYAEATAEYEALRGEKSIAADELLYRFAECARATGKNAKAMANYAEIFGKYPDSRHAPNARFRYAMGLTGAERKSELAALDSDRIPVDIRTAALYHLGKEISDQALLEKCIKLDPKGKLAPFATVHRATILSAATTAAERRKGIEILLEVAFGNHGELSLEALYLAGVYSYRERRFSEAGSLFRRYLKNYPNDSRASDVRNMSVWSDYMAGRYADAAAACGDAASDDLAYIKAACAYAQGDDDKALLLYKKYLEDFPQGKYRAEAELPIARIEFKRAENKGDTSMIIESAKRGYALSKRASDQFRLAWAYEKANRTDDALAEYLRIAKKFPKSSEAAEALYRKAMMDAREERWAAAELSLAEALATEQCGSRKGTVLYWRAVAAKQLGHEAEAIKFLQQALTAGISLDESREARLMIADYDYAEGRIDAAKTEYAKLVDEGACERMSAAKILAVGKLIGGSSAKKCANALIKSDSASWRQAGYTLLGTAEEAAGSYSAAIDAYRKAMAEDANVADVAIASLKLGVLEFRAGEYEKAEATLKRAVTLNTTDASARALAYVTLAENSAAKKDIRNAHAYATVVVSLFDDKAIVERAKKILDLKNGAKEGE